MTSVIDFAELRSRRHRRRVAFNRRELSRLLDVYSRRVASGEWRDYAIDHGEGFAAFSIFRHTHETPLYTVVKVPARDGEDEWAVYAGRQRLARGSVLADVLAVFDRKLSLVRD